MLFRSVSQSRYVQNYQTAESKAFKGRYHKALNSILYAVEQVRQANRDSRVSPYRALWLWGEHGSGKSFLVEQIATMLGLPFYAESLNNQSTMSQIVGTVNPMTEVFRSSLTTRAYSEGGLMVYEEAASAGGQVWTQLGACLAGRQWFHTNFGSLQKHPDFVPIFVDNTSGRGPTPAYPTRNRMDESTMSRCAVIHVGYDDVLDRELALELNPHAGVWIDWVMSVRKWIADENNAIKSAVYIDPRDLHCLVYDLARQPQSGSIGEILDRFIWKELSKDLRERILTACPLPQGRY